MKAQTVILLFSVLALHALVSYAVDTTTLSPEDAKRNEINQAIATLHDNCRKTVQAQTTGNETLEAGCKKLESFKALLGLVGCDTSDYNKLHAVLCYRNGVYVG